MRHYGSHTYTHTHISIIFTLLYVLTQSLNKPLINITKCSPKIPPPPHKTQNTYTHQFKSLLFNNNAITDVFHFGFIATFAIILSSFGKYCVMNKQNVPQADCSTNLHSTHTILHTLLLILILFNMF